jgi:hypothetical protein
MMAYALIIDNEVADYPFDLSQVRRRFPDLSFPEMLTDAALAAAGLVPVDPVDPPAVTAEQAAEEGPPVIADGACRQVWTVRARSESELAAAKAALLNDVDVWAERVRLRFITPGAGQAMTYIAKNAEAVVYLADNATPTPFLSAEAAAIDSTVAALALEVRDSAIGWQAAGAAIEANRRGLKVAIRTAGTFAELEAIDINEGWPA